jgi:hypothetical protein
MDIRIQQNDADPTGHNTGTPGSTSSILIPVDLLQIVFNMK